MQLLADLVTAFALAVVCREIHAHNADWPGDAHINHLWVSGEALHILWSAP